jgi:hypothetical protein
MRTLAGALVVLAGAIVFVGHEVVFAEVQYGGVLAKSGMHDFPADGGFTFAYVLATIGIVFMLLGLITDWRKPDRQ